MYSKTYINAIFIHKINSYCLPLILTKNKVYLMLMSTCAISLMKQLR